MSPDRRAPEERASSSATVRSAVVNALRCATIPIWLLVCVTGAWLWGGYVTLGLVFVTWRAAAKYG